MLASSAGETRPSAPGALTAVLNTRMALQQETRRSDRVACTWRSETSVFNPAVLPSLSAHRSQPRETRTFDSSADATAEHLGCRTSPARRRWHVSPRARSARAPRARTAADHSSTVCEGAHWHTGALSHLTTGKSLTCSCALGPWRCARCARWRRRGTAHTKQRTVAQAERHRAVHRARRGGGGGSGVVS
jgi:hypothetical protein